MNRYRGFTLIELMVTLSIASILIAVAAPSFVELSIRNRVVTYTNDFISTVNFARSEAVRRGAPISICKSDDGATCAGTWSDGWIVFNDANGNGAKDGGDAVLKVHDKLSTNYTLNASAALADSIVYTADGTAQAAGVLALCHDASPVGARAIVVTRMRPRVGRDTDNDGAPNTDAGNITDCTDPS